MILFKRDNNAAAKPKTNNQSVLAEVALNAIHDGVIITDKNGVIQFINPAAAQMININTHQAVGLDYGLVIKLESKEGRELLDRENPLIQAMTSGQPLEATQVSLLVSGSGQHVPVALSAQNAGDASMSRIITFRNITKELAEEGEQTEFISTASHEMRTPVATIDGYLSLALNPQTASIDERAKGYLEAAQRASKHLGKLFQDLLDVTRLDDGHIKPHFVPAEMVELIRSISDDYAVRARESKITYSFGSNESASFGGNRRMSQVVYGFVDTDFMREIMNNLLENAIKYTPAGGSIYVNVRGDGDRVLINVTDTGIGISAENLGHIFQKFYRVDNSDTRTIGGTGLGLYLVKQRAEAMGGKVWAESAFGEGSTFYVSLPRITSDEYEKRMIAIQNQQMMAPQSSPQPVSQPPNQPAAQSTVQPATQPVVPSVTQPLPQPLTQPEVSRPVTSPVPQAGTAAQFTPVSPSIPPPAPTPQNIPPQPVLQPSVPQVVAQPTPLVQTPINNNLNGEIK
ncbi:PAS domain-containing protein [Candidatus Saccharibacteria bacterium]|nr:PAS domain-containing protein [Candidatus Saccharibacteria bacterium]